MRMIHRFNSLNPVLPNTLPPEANFNNMDHANYCLTIVGEFIYNQKYQDALLKLAEIKKFFSQTQNPEIYGLFHTMNDAQMCHHAFIKFAFKWAQNQNRQQNSESPQNNSNNNNNADRNYARNNNNQKPNTSN